MAEEQTAALKEMEQKYPAHLLGFLLHEASLKEAGNGVPLG